jgi:pyruvate/2-oxoglutarate dehydrogenase complex dihydrolipoamide acyltransferase (E2) component
MSYVFELPEIGEGVVEGEVVSWNISVGDAVERDQPVCEIMTDKATVEISSPVSGTVTKLCGEPGDIIKVHAPLAEIDQAGGAVAAPEKAAEAPKAAPAVAAPTPTAPAAKPTPAPAVSTAPTSNPATRGQTKAPPAVRRGARELNVDIHQVPGTGPKGRVTHEDVHAFAHQEPASTPIAPPALPQVHPSGTEETIKIIGLRRKIAQQMVVAKTTAPHFTYVEEIDATRLVEVRNQLKAHAAARGVKLTYLPFIAKACSIAFRDFPNLNAWMNTDTYELTVKGDHNLGIATETPQGLFVPVCKNIEQKSILHIAAEMVDVTSRTRAGQASKQDLSGSTFTITSVGNIGGVLATPILNVPEVFILGVNKIRDRAMVVDGEICVRKMFYLSPSFDHRIIDGAVAARFVARVKELLETPESLLLELS